VPEKGPAILVCNHTSGLDPQLIQSACDRLITWMMAKEYYEFGLIKGVLDTVEVIPVKRDARDMTADARRHSSARDGKVLGNLPRRKDRDR